MDEIVQKSPPLGLFRLEISKNILDQDHRRIDDDPEIDRAERQEACILAPKHEQDDGEEQREWNIRAKMMALRKSPRKSHWMKKTRRQPNTRLCRTVWVVTDTSKLRS